METNLLSTQIIDHVAKPVVDSRALQGVLTRRVFGWIIDYVIIGLLTVLAAIVVFFLGILTLGLGWLLYGVLVPVVAALYVWSTLGGRRQATIGMAMMDVRLTHYDGRPIDGLTALAHTALFWVFNVVLTPLVLLATLFTNDKRTLHDLLLGTVVVRATP